MITYNEKGFYETTPENLNDSHIYDAQLSAAIVALIKDKSFNSILDLGCGAGQYVNHIQSETNAVCMAVDGNPATVILGDNFKVQDLTVPFDYNQMYDLIISLEVGEHIPAEYTDIYLDNIDKHVKNDLLLSWALPGQGGGCHVNELSNDEVIQKMAKRGYIFNEQLTTKFRNSISNAWWFKNTILYFNK